MSGFCPKCGKPEDDGQVYCSGCGYKFETPEQDETPRQPPMQPPMPPPAQPATPPQQSMPPQQAYYPPQYPYAQAPYPARPKKKIGLLVLSIVFFVLAAAAVAAVFVFGPYDAKPMELNGKWDCSLKVENIANSKTDYIKKDELNDVQNTQMQLSLDKNGEGTLQLFDMTFDVAYKGGKIAAKALPDGKLQISLEGTLKKEKDAYSFTGTWDYTIVKGKDRGAVASGSWKAALTGDEENSSPSGVKTDGTVSTDSALPSKTAATEPAGITAADLEGSWKGEMVLADIPGLDQNPNIPEADKETMRKDIGSKTEMIFLFKNGKLWIGDESDAGQAADAEMGQVACSGNSFNADVATPIGNAQVTGDMLAEGGKKTIKCKLVFQGIPAANSDTEKVTVVAEFSGEKQP